MPRPRHCRRIGCRPQSAYFKPMGMPMRFLEQVDLTLDEIEAIRLTDLEGLYQADAATRMGISRQTLGRILENTRRKIADALVNGKALSIGGGDVTLREEQKTSPCSGRFRHGQQRKQDSGNEHT